MKLSNLNPGFKLWPLGNAKPRAWYPHGAVGISRRAWSQDVSKSNFQSCPIHMKFNQANSHQPTIYHRQRVTMLVPFHIFLLPSMPLQLSNRLLVYSDCFMEIISFSFRKDHKEDFSTVCCGHRGQWENGPFMLFGWAWCTSGYKVWAQTCGGWFPHFSSSTQEHICMDPQHLYTFLSACHPPQSCFIGSNDIAFLLSYARKHTGYETDFHRWLGFFC